MDALEKLLTESNENKIVKGNWFNIRWTPDLATGEVLNIGVGFVENGRVYSRILNYFERLKCLFGERGVYHAGLVTSIVAESLRLNEEKPPIPQVTYKNNGFAQGVSVDEILSSLFDQTVPLGRKIVKSKSKERFSSLNADKLYTCLLDELKLIARLDFERFVPTSSSILVDDDSGRQELFVPFRDGHTLIGGLASSVYSSVSTIELNLLKAARDVETAIKLGKGSRASIFILKPACEVETLKKEQIIRIENTLDKFDWHMTKQGIAVGSHTTVEGLASEIYDWARVA